MQGLSEFSLFLFEQLKDHEFRAEYEVLEPEFAIIQGMIDANKNADNGENLT